MIAVTKVPQKYGNRQKHSHDLMFFFEAEHFLVGYFDFDMDNVSYRGGGACLHL